MKKFNRFHLMIRFSEKTVYSMAQPGTIRFSQE